MGPVGADVGVAQGGEASVARVGVAVGSEAEAFEAPELDGP